MKKISLLGAMLLLVAANYGNAITVQWKDSGYNEQFKDGATLSEVRHRFEDKLGFPAKYMSISGQTQSGDTALLKADKPGKTVKVEPTYMGKIWKRKDLKAANDKAAKLANVPRTQPYKSMPK